MLDGIVFCRRTAGGRGNATSGSDVLFSRVKDSKTSDSLSVRVSGEVMRNLRWMAGDYVIAYPQDSGRKWVVERVQGPKQGGIKLCKGSSDTGCGTARFTHDNKVLDRVFANGVTSFTGTVCDSDGNKAIVVVD